MAQVPKKAKKKSERKAAKRKSAAGEPSSQAIEEARTIIYGVLRTRFGDISLRDDLKLATLKFNPTNLAGLAQNIRDAGVPINNAPIQVSKTIIEVIIAVARVIDGTR
jgi:hypothetical protein